MTRLQILAGSQGMQFALLRQFLHYNEISTDLSMRVLACAQHFVREKQRNRSESDIELLAVLSEPLRSEIHHEFYGPVLGKHPFFHHYHQSNRAAVQKLCHTAVSVISIN